MQQIITYILASLGAGVGTGLAGLSAATVISPMLIAFANVDPYEAVAIALAADVLASFASARVYYKNKNIDLRSGMYMLVCVLLFTVIGSVVASFVSANVMGSFSTYMTLLIGISFLFKKERKEKSAKEESMQKRNLKACICGSIIGFICGFIGAGGGMMMLLCLNTFLGYPLKTAVGTSVFIMGFTALTGSVSHFAVKGITNLTALIICVICTLFFATISAKFANKTKENVLNKVTGTVLTILGAGIILLKYI